MNADLVVSAEVQGLATQSFAPLRVVEVLAFGSMTTTEVAHHLRVHQRTARRALVLLHERGWVHRLDGPRPRWELSGRVLALASRAAHGTLGEQTAIALVDDLYEDTGHPVYAVIPCYDGVCCVADSRFDTLLQRGGLASAVENVGGVALLAYRPRWRDQTLALAGVDADEWASRLAYVRRNGYAAEFLNGGLAELAFPVCWRGDPATAALVVGNVIEPELAEMVARVFDWLERRGRRTPGIEPAP